METILLILGGLGLFLFAISHLSEALKHLLGDRAKKLLAKFTRNVFTAILTGIVITLILDSSSAVIIMAIVLVNAKALTFRQAIGIVLGPISVQHSAARSLPWISVSSLQSQFSLAFC